MNCIEMMCVAGMKCAARRRCVHVWHAGCLPAASFACLCHSIDAAPTLQGAQAPRPGRQRRRAGRGGRAGVGAAEPPQPGAAGAGLQPPGPCRRSDGRRCARPFGSLCTLGVSRRRSLLFAEWHSQAHRRPPLSFSFTPSLRQSRSGAFKHDTRLETLKLGWCKLGGGEGARALADLLMFNSSLVTVSCGRCNGFCACCVMCCCVLVGGLVAWPASRGPAERARRGEPMQAAAACGCLRAVVSSADGRAGWCEAEQPGA